MFGFARLWPGAHARSIPTTVILPEVEVDAVTSLKDGLGTPGLRVDKQRSQPATSMQCRQEASWQASKEASGDSCKQRRKKRRKGDRKEGSEAEERDDWKKARQEEKKTKKRRKEETEREDQKPAAQVTASKPRIKTSKPPTTHGPRAQCCQRPNHHQLS